MKTTSKKLTALKERIRAINPSAFVDGPSNPELYLANPVRLLWILKEPYSNDDLFHDQAAERAEVECLAELCSNKNSEGAQSFKKIVQLAHSIEMGQLVSDDVFESKEAYRSFLKNTALVNLKKEPNTNGTKSNESELKVAWPVWGDTIKEQIALSQPTVIIYGGTFPLVEGGFKNFWFEKLLPHLSKPNDEAAKTFCLLGDTIKVNECYYLQHQHLVVMPGEKHLHIYADHPSVVCNLLVPQFFFVIQSYLEWF